MSAYSGRKGMVYLSTTGSGGVTLCLKVSEWTLDQSTDMYEVTAFGDANKTYVSGLKDVKGTFKAFYDDTETKPFVAADSADGCKVYLYPSSDALGRYWYGPAWLNVSIDCPVSGAVSLTANFSANGAWGRL